MQDATRRPPVVHYPGIQYPGNQGNRSFARIDAIDVRPWGPFAAAMPIARLIAAFFAALARFRLAEPRCYRDDEAVKILGNAGRMEMVTRSHWKTGAHSGGARSQLPPHGRPSKQ
ncbi:hypothetical protein [Cupriavidus basilensis]|uniref:hypothetical protein n=1 Tax=Cupriavidus basilensis TaxID=68895 RepID=UPI0023E8F749|nr:hypothetical protein [Cupriavidus basilensis]MDF3881284.1 hypothetical protein [Cupriavidus basilensis]